MNFRLFLTFLFSIILLVSCDKSTDPVPNYEEPEKYYRFFSSGENQYNGINKYLQDSIAVYVIDSLTNEYLTGMQVNFKVISGGGDITNSTMLTNDAGCAYTFWLLGDKSHEQKLQAEIVNEEKQIINTIDFSAYAFRPKQWDEVVIGPHCYFNDLIADTLNKITLGTTTSKLWKQGKEYYEWNQLMTPEILPHGIELDSKGTIYINGYYGGLEKSNDQGETWIPCNDPYGEPEKNDERFIMRVTSDNDIWLSKYGKRFYHSKDEGVTWSLDTIGLESDSFMDEIFRLKSGTLVLRMGNGKCFKSINDGASWSPMNTTPNPVKLYVTKNDEIISVYNESPHVALYKSKDEGQTFQKTFSRFTRSDIIFPRHIFHEYNGDYYVMLQDYGVLKTKDFESFEDFYYKSTAHYFFIDHRKTLMIFQQDWKKAFYKSEAI
jgi:hypothetical protein